jgi:hypothetical protein
LDKYYGMIVKIVAMNQGKIFCTQLISVNARIRTREVYCLVQSEPSSSISLVVTISMS